jgi:hypothetical protein
MRAVNNNPLHLVVRFSDTMFGVGDVVAEHNDLVNKHGAVWFGKLGSPLAQIRIDLLNKQIEQRIPTFLYLVKGNRKKSSAYCASLLFVSRDFPKDKALIPAYYKKKKLTDFMKVWMKIGKIELIEMEDMGKLKAINSIYPIAETLVRSSSGYFLVHESKSIF